MKVINMIIQKEKVYNTVSELYNKKFENYYDEYDGLSDAKKKISSIKNPSLQTSSLKIMMDGLQMIKRN